MANFNSIKKKARAGKGRLGKPPELPETQSNNLEAPEAAPATYIDGRSQRRTGRTVAFSTRVSPEWHRRFKQVAARDGYKLNELLEHALAAYEDRHGRLD